MKKEAKAQLIKPKEKRPELKQKQRENIKGNKRKLWKKRKPKEPKEKKSKRFEKKETRGRKRKQNESKGNERKQKGYKI